MGPASFIITQGVSGMGKASEMKENTAARVPLGLTPRRRLGEILIDAGVLAEADLKRAMSLQEESGERLGTILVSQGLVNEDVMLSALETQLGIPRVHLARYIISPEVAQLVPEMFARANRVFPIEKTEDYLTLAMADPLDVFAMDDVRIMTGLEVEPVIASDIEIQAAINEYFGTGPGTKLAREVEAEADEPILQTEEEKREDAQVLSQPAVRLTNAVISEAVKARASDVHIEPQEKDIRVRYRIDGVLREVMTFPLSLGPAVVSRIKVKAGMDIAERRLPQDGRVELRLDGEEIDLRVSTLPTIYGEKAEVRILRSKGVVGSLEELGFLDKDVNRLKCTLQNPNGIILVTGPTGSGKTMTLYAALQHLNTEEKSIVTIEDPVEFRIPGVSQVQTNAKAGLTFAQGLRAILRQDPDIVMVGEVRDRETAEIAVRFAMTGHLVLSTFHTINAAGALIRLTEMGIEPYLVASSVTTVVAQRLVRKICPYCVETYKVDDATWDAWKVLAPEIAGRVELGRGRTFKRGRGCRQCGNTGFLGRTAICEIMNVAGDIRSLVMQGAPAEDIEEAAVRGGMTKLAIDGVSKVFLGITSQEELGKVCTVPKVIGGF
jgi:type IV pilus assembly protein PilB